MKKQYTYGIMTLALVAILGVGFVAAMPFGNSWNSQITDEEREEQRQAMQDAIETGNYASWEGLMQERLSKMEDSINQETFIKLQERHENKMQFRVALEDLKESGDATMQDYQTLKEEYGIEGSGMHKKGLGQKGFGEGIRNSGNCPYQDLE